MTPIVRRAPRALGAYVAILSVLLCACGREEPPPGAPRGARATNASARPGHGPVGRSPTRDERPEPPPALRVTGAEGEGAPPITVGETLSDGRAIAAGPHELTLDFERGARVVVERGARFARSAASPMGLALGEGALRVDLPPEGGSARPPLRVAGPRGTVAIGGSGELLVAALPDGSVFVLALRGLAEVIPGSVDSAGRLESERVGAGRALLVGSDARLREPPPRSLEEAAVTIAQLARRAARRSREELRALLSDSLAASVERFDAELARGLDLRARHRAAVAARGNDVVELQRAIIAHAQALLRARRAVQSAFERAEALALVTDGGDAWLAELRTRAATALRLPR